MSFHRDTRVLLGVDILFGVNHLSILIGSYSENSKCTLGLFCVEDRVNVGWTTKQGAADTPGKEEIKTKEDEGRLPRNRNSLKDTIDD